MAEQLALTPEPTTPPQGEIASAPKIPDGVPTFADMPESRPPWTPQITFAEESPADSDAQNPEPVAAGSATPPPPAGQPQAPQATGQDFFQALAAYEMWKEGRQAEKSQAEQARNWEPPAISEQEAEAMLTDPKTIAATFRARDKFHRDATVNLMKPLVEKIQMLESQVQTVNYREHQYAWQETREAMQKRGIDADKYYGQIYQAIQQNPNTAPNILRDANALSRAVMFMHGDAAAEESPFTNPAEPAKRPLSAGNGQAASETPRARRKDEAILKAEKAFGRKFTPEMVDSYYQNTAGGKRA